MKMTVRQLSHLIDGEVVSERHYDDPSPDDILGTIRLILANCRDLVGSEDIAMGSDVLELKRLILKHPSVAGELEVIIGEE